MSMAALKWGRDQRGIVPTAKLILMLAADNAGMVDDLAEVMGDDSPRQVTFIGVSRLATDACLDERNARKWIAYLEERGLLRRVARTRANGSQKTNYIVFPIDERGEALPFDPGAADIPPGRERPGTRAGAPPLEPNLEPTLEPQKTPSSSSEVARTRATRATRLPDDFTVTEDMKTWARENVPNIGWIEHEKFVDHFLSISGPNSRKVDWVRAWRNWMRRANEQTYRRPQPQFKTAHEKRQESAKNVETLIDEAVALVESRGGSENDSQAVYRAMQEVKAQRSAHGSMTSTYNRQLELPS